jgi:dihydrofolate reductase
MGRIVVNMSLTLDGVVQAPGRPDEDTRGGFRFGGWAVPYADPEMGRRLSEGSSRTEALLFGRRTYEDFYAYWPSRSDGNPFTPVLNDSQKYVVSRTLREPLPWQRSALLPGDAAGTVPALKQRIAGDLLVLGSGELVRSLLAQQLVDELVLQIHPLVLGSGRRLFDGGPPAALRLVSATTTATGVIVSTYQPSGPVPPSA